MICKDHTDHSLIALLGCKVEQSVFHWIADRLTIAELKAMDLAKVAEETPAGIQPSRLSLPTRKH